MLAVMLLILAALVAIYRRELQDWLEPDFRVTAIKSAEATMTLERANHRYTVRCSEMCTKFRVGSHYHMEYRGAVLEYRQRAYPIIEVEVFPTTSGGFG
jgi:hypothetical protein